MTDEDIAVPETTNPGIRLAAAVRACLVEGKLTCAGAFAIARQLNVGPLAVGHAADVLRVGLSQCQLGLFGYPGKHGWHLHGTGQHPVPEGIGQAIEQARGDSGALTCADAWRIAESFGVTRMQVGYLADEMGVKISPCQLGVY